MAFAFKPQQQLALDYPGNVAVSAGAGSGKTRVLVEKYFRLLADEHPTWPIDSVIAITFTVKAAGELKQRIVQRIREELRAEYVPPARRERLLHMRREISGAPIGTIHNFCSRTLREFAFEARLNPDFAIVEGAHESSLRREAAIQAVAESVSAPGTQAYLDVVTLHNIYRRSQIFTMLSGMLSRRNEYAPVCRRYAETEEDSLYAELDDLCRSISEETRDRLLHDLQNCVEGFARAAAGKADELMLSFRNQLRELADSKVSGSKVLGLAEEVTAALFTREGTLRKAVEKSLGLSGESECVKRLLAACEECADAGVLQVSDVDRQSITLTAMLARLYLRAESIYATSRSAAQSTDDVDLLDFTDLEIMAEQLITSNSRVRSALRKRINYLIVDEFQDTSETQWRILGPLVCDEDGDMLPSRFFMVGDPKQGVYGFRQASSRLFAHVRDLVTQSNPPGGSRGDIAIAYNFRTLPAPLRTVNELFSGLMDSTLQHEVRFEALEPQRRDPSGCTTLLLAAKARTPGAEEDGEDFGDVEAALVADEIAALAAGDGAQSRTIAVLLRKRKHFEIYEHALRSRGVAYHTHRGRGLYEQPEVLALLAVLRLLADPGNDLVAAQVARGPLFNFHDDLLLKVALSTESTYYSKCCGLLERGHVQVDGSKIMLHETETSRLQQFTVLIGTLNSMLGLHPVERLLRTIIQQTGAVGIFGLRERGEQAMANIDLFVELSRSIAAADLDEFLSYVESESINTQSQGQAAVHGIAGAVQIMTIHAAKGLEFDEVFLPELADPITTRREDVLTDGERWLSLQKTLSAEKPKLFLTSYLEKEKLKRAMAEEKRVLYVAMTRCKDNLYLSATEGGAREENSFYGWIQPRLAELSIVQKSSAKNVELQDVGYTRIEPGQAQKIQLHSGSFERRIAESSKILNASHNRSADVDQIRTGLPFSPPAPRPCQQSIDLEVLLAVSFNPDAACEHLVFRHHLQSLLLRSARTHTRNITVPAPGHLDLTLSAQLNELISKALEFRAGLRPSRNIRPGMQASVRSSELLLHTYADLECDDQRKESCFFSTSNEALPFVQYLAAAHCALLENVGYHCAVQIIDLESGTAHAAEQLDISNLQVELERNRHALTTRLDAGDMSLSKLVLA